MTATYEFGAVGKTGCAEGTYGLLQDFADSRSGSEATRKNGQGLTKLFKVYDEQSEISATYVHDTTVAAPRIGDILVINSLAYYVTKADIAQKIDDWEEIKLTFKRFIDGALPTT